MNDNEPLCIKVLRVLQQMLEKEVEYGEKVGSRMTDRMCEKIKYSFILGILTRIGSCEYIKYICGKKIVSINNGQKCLKLERN